jgi:hypothetical protein
MSYPVVLAIDSESCSAAIVALETLTQGLTEGKTRQRLEAAIQDFNRAIAQFHMIDEQIKIPALLKRQAG